MDFEIQIEYWLQSAEHDLDTAYALIKEKKYDWALYLSHLVLEKILRAIIIKNTKKFPEKTHNLVRLAGLAGMTLKEDEIIFMEQVNSFHIAARYPDEQQKIFQLCTEDFTFANFRKVKEMAKWLMAELQR